MAQLGYEFNSAEVEERKSFEPLPAGSYIVMITESEMKPTSTNGEMLVFTMEVQEGQYQGRKVFDRLNVKNANADAQNIAFQTLGEICRAVGTPKIKDSEELHNKRLSITVKVEPAREYVKDGVKKMGEPQNSIKKYLPAGAPGAVGVTAAATAATPATASSATGLPPWKKQA